MRIDSVTSMFCSFSAMELSTFKKISMAKLCRDLCD